MTQKEREIQRRLRILRHAEETGHVGQTSRYFGIGRATFYRWKAALEKYGEVGVVRKKSIPKNRTPPEIVEKVLYLRKSYHLGPMRIVWYLARYHDIKISGAGVTRIFKRNCRIEIDSNIVERAIRPIALNRKNALFAGSDGGGEHWALIASLIET